MRAAVLFFTFAFTCPLASAGEATTGKKAPPYRNDPAILKILGGLGEGVCVYLPPMKTAGKGMETVRGFKKRGPDVRDYGNKLAYAPDRRTAMYCGANHGTPHRLNDASEYHLGSNTWHLICPAGTDATRLRRMQNAEKKLRTAIAKGQDAEKNKAELAKVHERMKAWFAGVEVKDGYLQDKANGGPVQPWHTWDGIAYDRQAGCLVWAVLDTDVYKDPKKGVQKSKTRQYAKLTGQDPEKLVAQLKPSSSMYMYDPGKRRWRRQMGAGPFPYMRGMGGSLLYVPDMKRTVWYCAAQNVIPNDFAMWAYDARTNKWTDLKPNAGRAIRTLVFKDKVAPTGELQMAYSPRHKKIAAVSKAGTWIYDIAANRWSKGCEDKENKAHDAVSVFAYDSNADVFLLLNAPDRWGSKRILRAYSLAKNKWQTITPKGKMFERRKYCGNAGYYDPRHNVFAVYGSTDRIWVYRHKRAKAKSSAAKPKSASPKKTAAAPAPAPARKAPTRTPKQVCTGWFSAARNYKRVGMLADARRCLNNIVRTYPKSEWAEQARSELGKL